MFQTQEAINDLKKKWTNKFVSVIPGTIPELKRFEGKVGRVVTVNYSGRAVVDFADGAWYDIVKFTDALVEVTDEAEQKKYNPAATSAQAFPSRQS